MPREATAKTDSLDPSLFCDHHHPCATLPCDDKVHQCQLREGILQPRALVACRITRARASTALCCRSRPIGGTVACCLPLLGTVFSTAFTALFEWSCCMCRMYCTQVWVFTLIDLDICNSSLQRLLYMATQHPSLPLACAGYRGFVCADDMGA